MNSSEVCRNRSGVCRNRSEVCRNRSEVCGNRSQPQQSVSGIPDTEQVWLCGRMKLCWRQNSRVMERKNL